MAASALASVPGAGLEVAAAALLDPAFDEAAAAASARVVRGLKESAFFCSAWCAASASAARFFLAFAAYAAVLSFAPSGLPLRIL